MTKGPPQNANCSFWNGLLGYGPTWRQNLLYFFPAAVGLACLDVMSSTSCACGEVVQPGFACAFISAWKRLAVPPMLSPSWRCQSQVWSVHQLTSQALWKEINNVCRMFNYRLSSAAKPLLTAQSSRSGRFEGWLGAESKDAPELSLHVEPVISWSIFSITTFISVALSSPQSCNCT